MYNLGYIQQLGDNNKSIKKIAKMQNNISWMNTLMRAINIALHRYKITGLPDTIKERDIKRYFLYHGNVILFMQGGGWFALPGGGMSDINLNGNPGRAWVYGQNGFSKEVKLAIPGGLESSFARKGISGQIMSDSDEAFYIRENYMNFPFINYAIELSNSISDTMRTLDVARKHIKRPYIFAAPASMKATILAELSNIDNNEECVLSSGVLDPDKIKYFPLDQNPESIKTATDLIEWYWNLYFELCGINSNSNPDKKAQLTTVEVNANNDAVEMQAEQVIQSLQEDFDFFNKRTGHNIKVEKLDFMQYNSIQEEGTSDDDNSNKDIQSDTGRKADN